MKNKQKNRRLFRIPALLLVLTLALSACQKGPDKEELREQAIASFTAGNYEAAETQLNQALEAGKGEVSAFQFDILQYRGECELRLGKYAKAQKTYEALLAADSDPKNQTKYQAIVEDLANAGEVEAAVKQLEDGAYEEAYAVFDQYASLEGSFVGKIAWFNKAVSAEYQQKYDEAYELLNQYLKKYPEDAEAQKELDFLKTR